MGNDLVTTGKRLDADPLFILERIVPKVWLTLDEAKHIAELQANRLRGLLKVNGPALPHESIMEMPHIKVNFDPDMPAALSGTAIWGSGSWIILLNGLESESRQRFTMAHELKHILDHNRKQFLYHDTYNSSAAQKAEQTADYFAGCLLMPKSQVKRLYYQGIRKPTELSPYFRVSPMAMRVRLWQLGLVGNSDRCDNWTYSEERPAYSRLSEPAWSLV